MNLYITPGSPYARMARVVVLEKRLESRWLSLASCTPGAFRLVRSNRGKTVTGGDCAIQCVIGKSHADLRLGGCISEEAMVGTPEYAPRRYT